MKKIIFLLAIVTIAMNSFAQNSNRTLLTVAGEEVSVDDFLSVYNKNRQVGEELDPKTLDEYVELFVNFKLKVKEAETLGMDTIPSFVKELSGYRKQLAKPYLVDNEVGEQLIQEAYERLKMEVRASHILISVAEDATPTDTLKAYKKIQQLRKEVLAGADFASTARAYSQDPSAKDNAGDLGYFSALYMVYPFENAAYNTAQGEVSEIIRSRFGYHFLKVTDKRLSRGEVKAAHIMVKFTKPAGQNTPEEITIAQQKINEIYQKIVVENAGFAEMAKQYSDDKNSAAKGGELPWFGTNKMVASFENTAFSLENKGDISEPVQTPYGWHIIKLVDRKSLGSFDDEKDEIKKKVEKDSRAQVKQTSLVNKLKKEYNYKVNRSAVSALKNYVDTDFFAGKWSLEDHMKDLTKTVFTLGDTKYTQADFVAYLIKSARRMKNKVDASVFTDEAFAKWSEDAIIAYENVNLEAKYNDFRLLMQEYRDGILLYELTDEKIWTKAVKDTTGLKDFYQANKQNYIWDTRVEAKVINCLNENIACKVYKKLSKGNTDVEKVQAKMNKKSTLNMDVKEGLFLKGENTFVDQVEWIEGVSDLIYDNQNVKIVYVEEVFASQVKELKETKGLVTSDYQDFLEKQWLVELKAKYPVRINNYVLDLVKNNRLDELDVVDEVEEVRIPVFKGHFNKAFRKAVNTLGSSKDIIFEWYGNLYTTELK